jgi:hypothetical protein
MPNNQSKKVMNLGNKNEIKAPNFVSDKLACIFLVGSIEMGVAENWQEKVVRSMKNTHWVILNPRRDDWDSSGEQKISNPKFNEQVNWELQGIEQAEKVIVYFDPKTKSPITLLELGLLAGVHPEKVVVVCPDGYWRKGNVDVVCDRYRIRQCETIEEAIIWLK